MIYCTRKKITSDIESLNIQAKKCELNVLLQHFSFFFSITSGRTATFMSLLFTFTEYFNQISRNIEKKPF